jgi:hypothetical protein
MLYTFAGTSVLKGELKVRFANSDARARQLAKLGDTNVNIVPLPSEMDKAAAVAYLLTLPAFDSVQDALRAEVAVKAKPACTVKVRVSKVKPSKTAPSMDSIRAKAAKARAKAAEVIVTEAEVDSLMMAVFGTK